MTDPNMPPPERPIERPAEPIHHTTVNVAPERGGGGGGSGGLIIGALVIVAIIVAAILFLNSRPAEEKGDTNLDVNIDVPSLPDTPKMPDLPDAPTLPPVEPPTLPGTAPSE